jgi:hypothetical protein
MKRLALSLIAAAAVLALCQSAEAHGGRVAGIILAAKSQPVYAQPVVVAQPVRVHRQHIRYVQPVAAIYSQPVVYQQPVVAIQQPVVYQQPIVQQVQSYCQPVQQVQTYIAPQAVVGGCGALYSNGLQIRVGY